jgi:hypothetical protein
VAGAGEGRHGEQHRRGAVVDRERVLGAGQLAEQVCEMLVAVRALPRVQVQLEIGVATREGVKGFRCAVGKGCSAEVRVEHDPCAVEHPLHGRLQPRASAREEVCRRRVACL